MKLKDLLDLTSPEAGFSVAGLSHEQVSKIEVTGLTSDSRAVQAGNLFAALTGTREDGAAYIADAEMRGAVVAMAGAGTKANGASIPVLETDDPRLQLARAAAAFYNAQPETMVAVTGTAGKTSVASFTRQIWAAGGMAAASIGTTGIVSPSGSEYGALTTPDPVHLHQLLARLAGEGVTHAAFEASSHGLEQRRLDGVRLAAGGFTNLGHDHLDYHSTMEDYFDAKMRLFEALLPKRAPAVIYADDAWSRQAEDRARAAGLDCLTVGRSGTFLSLKRVEHERSRQSAEIQYADRFYRIRLPLAGDFQIANALVSAGLAMATGLDADTAIGALENLSGAPGRLELVGTTRQGAPVYVDYAHKPDALRQVLSSVRPFTTGRVMVVFGCGGDRDRAKRPMMGQIAEELSDLAIVTDDNPRSEDPAAIRAAILTEAPSAIEIADRRSAIREAIGRLGSGDTLVIAGKGHEEGQIVGGKTHPFSDHQEARAALEVHA